MLYEIMSGLTAKSFETPRGFEPLSVLDKFVPCQGKRSLSSYLGLSTGHFAYLETGMVRKVRLSHLFNNINNYILTSVTKTKQYVDVI